MKCICDNEALSLKITESTVRQLLMYDKKGLTTVA